MEKGNQVYFQDENSWFDCIGDIQGNTVPANLLNHETEMLVQENDISLNVRFAESVHTSFTNDMKDTQEESFKRLRGNEGREQEYYTENSSSNEIKSKLSDSKLSDQQKGKLCYTAKDHIYSKNYRQRKKQKVKYLSQENEFLKKKIHDLEFRLRQMQLEVNRLKFMPEQKDYTVEQLNNEFMEKVTVIMEKNKDNPDEFKSKYDPKDPFYSEFMDTYAKHGFGGSKKIQILNYYYNQILQAILRDSERYFCMMCLNSKSGYDLKGFPEYEIIQNVFFDILKPDEDKLKRLEYFQVNLHPLVLEFFAACQEFDNKFKSVEKSMHKIHEFMRINYPANFDFARMRIVELQTWFEKQKYTKMMRNLRAWWLDELKKDMSEEADGRKRANGTKKKKKIVQKQQ